ncbi:MAG: hypothetical protein AAF430_18315 [Myxococcota bacterium]
MRRWLAPLVLSWVLLSYVALPFVVETARQEPASGAVLIAAWFACSVLGLVTIRGVSRWLLARQRRRLTAV